MTKITIHGQKMQYHKKVAILVSLVQPTPYGTLTYTPAPGQPGLSSLPIGAQIVESNGDYLIKHNNVTIGEVEVSPASGYEFKNMVLWKDSGASITISTTPITLDDSDGITAILASTMKQINFYLGWEYQSYGDPWSYVRLSYNGQSLNPNESYIEMQNNRDKVDLTINSGGVDGTFKFYVNGTPSSSDGLRAQITNATYKISRIEYYNPDTGTTYTCDGTSTVIGNVGSMGMARILLDIAQSCDLVDWQTAGWTSPNDKSNGIRDTLQQVVGQYGQFQDFQAAAPSNLSYGYILYDGGNCCGLAYGDLRYVYYDPQSGQSQNINTTAIVAFFDDGYNLYATPYEIYPAWQYQVLPQWSNTSLSDPRGYVNQVFNYGDENVLGNWIQDWQCGDTCGLMQTIYNLATNK